MSRALVLALLAGCSDTTGTLAFRLVHPEGQARLPAAVTTVRITLDDPPLERTAPVDASGDFVVDLDFPTDGVVGRLTFEGRGAAGDTLVVGRSPPLPLDGRNDVFSLFVSPPGEFAVSPLELTGNAAVPTSFGAMVTDGEAMTAFNVYEHALQPGEPLPAPDAGATLFAGEQGLIYVFAGGTLDAFDTTVAPRGRYIRVADEPAFARDGAPAARLPDGRYVIGGEPVLRFDPLAGTLAVWEEAPVQVATSATRLGDAVLLVGPAGSGWVSSSGVSAFAFSAADHAAVAGDSSVLVVDELRVTRVHPDGSTQVAASLARSRRGAAVAISDGLLVVAGGEDDDAPHASAEVFSLAENVSLGETPLATPRVGACAVTLANRAILLIGGATDPSAGDTVEIFQP